jgi:hypothetical protein
MDVGANVCDSALQVVDAVDLDSDCLDDDPYRLPFLRERTARDRRVQILDARRLPSSPIGSKRFTSIQTCDPTRFVSGGGTREGSTTTVEWLGGSLLELAPMRLIESDQNWDVVEIRGNDPHHIAIKRDFCT